MNQLDAMNRVSTHGVGCAEADEQEGTAAKWRILVVFLSVHWEQWHGTSSSVVGVIRRCATAKETAALGLAVVAVEILCRGTKCHSKNDRYCQY